MLNALRGANGLTSWCLFAQGLLRLTSANAGEASVITPSTPGHHVRPFAHATTASHDPHMVLC